MGFSLASGTLVLVQATALVALAFILLAAFSKNRTTLVSWLGLIVLVLCLCSIFAVTFQDSYGRRSVNLVPFVSIIRQTQNINASLGLTNIFGNVLMFAPVGALVFMFLGRIRAALLVCVGLSCTIEALQFISGRVADIDDVILNSVGGLVGVLIARWLISMKGGHAGKW